MKLSDKLVDDLIKTSVGEEILPLIKLLKNKRNVSEFKLAEKLNLSINEVRNMLYRLNSHNLANSIRRKDDKKGWYIYYWTFNTKQAKSLILKLRESKFNRLNQELAKESTKQFYSCPEGCLRLELSKAMENDFKCLECGSLLKEDDNSKRVNKIKRKIASIKKEVVLK